VELFQKDFLVGRGLGIAAHDEGAPIGGREVDVEHLDGGKLVQHSAGSQPRGMEPQTGSQSDVEAVCNE